MIEIPNSYPDKLSDEQIMEVISQCSEVSVKASKKNSNYSLGPSFYNSMAELGQIELNKRIQKKLLDVIENQRLDNRKASFTNKSLSVLTIVLAIITIYFGSKTLGFAQVDEVTDAEWKAEQIELLNQNNSKLESILKYLENKDLLEINKHDNQRKSAKSAGEASDE